MFSCFCSVLRVLRVLVFSCSRVSQHFPLSKTAISGAVAVWMTFAYLYYQNAEVDSSGDLADAKDSAQEVNDNDASKTMAKIAAKNAASAAAKAKLVTEKFARKAKALQRLIVAKMQVLTAILATIMWSPEVPPILLEVLSYIGGFVTFDIPALLSTPDCLFDIELVTSTNATLSRRLDHVQIDATSGGEGGMAPVDKWHLELLAPWTLMFLVFVPCCYYNKWISDRKVEDDTFHGSKQGLARKKDGWNK